MTSMAVRLKIERIVDPGGRRIAASRVTNGRLQRSIFRILQETTLCSIATVSGLNKAHINTAYFAYSKDLELYFLSDPGAVHCKNVSINPSMAMTIFNSLQTWGKPDRGLQLFGTCRDAKGVAAAKAERAYARRFPQYARRTAHTHSDKSEGSRLRSYHFYRFVPNTIKVFDEPEFGSGVFVVMSVGQPRLMTEGCL